MHTQHRPCCLPCCSFLSCTESLHSKTLRGYLYRLHLVNPLTLGRTNMFKVGCVSHCLLLMRFGCCATRCNGNTTRCLFCIAQPASASYTRQRGFGGLSMFRRAPQCPTSVPHFNASVLCAGSLSRSGLGRLPGCCYCPALRPWSGFPAFR